jgi:hypothetical protein
LIVPEFWDAEDISPDEFNMLKKPKHKSIYDSKEDSFSLKNFSQMIVREQDGTKWTYEMCLDTKDNSGGHCEP